MEAVVAERNHRVESELADLADQLDNFASSVYSGDQLGDSAALKDRQRAVVESWIERQSEWLASPVESVDGLDDRDDDRDDFGASEGADTVWATIDALIDRRDEIGAAAQRLLRIYFGKSEDELAEEIKHGRSNPKAYFAITDRLFKDADGLKSTERIMGVVAAIPDILELAGLLRDLTGEKTPEHERVRQAELKRIQQSNDDAVDMARGILEKAVAEVDVVADKEIEALRARMELARTSAVDARTRAAAIEEAINALRLTLT